MGPILMVVIFFYEIVKESFSTNYSQATIVYIQFKHPIYLSVCYLREEIASSFENDNKLS